MIKYTIELPDEYDVLLTAIQAMIDRCTTGKGKQRHQEYEKQPFMQQQIMRFSHGFRIDQIQKKASESARLKKPAAAFEMLDVAIYALAEWLVLQREMADRRVKEQARPAKLKEFPAFEGQHEAYFKDEH